MRYHYQRGVIVPFVKKYLRVLCLAAAATFIFTQMVVLAGFARAENDPQPPAGADCLTTEFANGNNQVVTCVVSITCDGVSIWASHNLSNVIVVYQDGSYTFYPSFDNTNIADIPQGVSPIIGLWIHAGNNDYGPDPEPAEYGNGQNEGRFHQVAPPDCDEEDTPPQGDTTPEEDLPQEVLGQITGLIYHDQNNDGNQDPGEPPLENWNGWLLTYDGTFVLEAEDTTGSDGLFSFLDLPLGTYYVCQNLQTGWAQTELAALGAGLEAVPVDTDLGDTPELQTLIAEFCYPVELTEEDPSSDSSVFGNFQPSQGQVQGDSTTREDEKSSGVLAATTGQVLAATGQPTYWPMALGIFLLLGSLLTIRLVPQK